MEVKVSMNGLRKGLAREFNEYVKLFNGDIPSGHLEKLQELRQYIAVLLLVCDEDEEGFTELDPDKYLISLDGDEDRNEY